MSWSSTLLCLLEEGWVPSQSSSCPVGAAPEPHQPPEGVCRLLWCLLRVAFGKPSALAASGAVLWVREVAPITQLGRGELEEASLHFWQHFAAQWGTGWAGAIQGVRWWQGAKKNCREMINLGYKYSVKLP